MATQYIYQNSQIVNEEEVDGKKTQICICKKEDLEIKFKLLEN
jgi:hypothetical protein